MSSLIASLTPGDAPSVSPSFRFRRRPRPSGCHSAAQRRNLRLLPKPRATIHCTSQALPPSHTPKEATTILDRYTDDARQLILLARYEASRLGSHALEPAHLWLALLRKQPKLVRRLAPHITLAHLEDILGAAKPRLSITADLPISPVLQHALAAAPLQADRLHKLHITPEVLIRTLLLEGPPPRAH